MRTKPLSHKALSVFVSVAMALSLMMQAPIPSLAEEPDVGGEELVVSTTDDTSGDGVIVTEGDGLVVEDDSAEEGAGLSEENEAAEETLLQTDEEVDSASDAEEPSEVSDEADSTTDVVLQTQAANAVHVKTEEELRTELDKKGNSIVLDNDIALSGSIEMRSINVTLNLAGHTLSCATDRVFLITSPVTDLIIMDTSVMSTGVITSSYKGPFGGAIVNFGKISIQGNTFKNCKVGDRGGAIFNKGEIDLINCWFENCEAKYGGAIYNAGTLKITGGKFKNNKAEDSGGAIAGSGILKAVQCTITGNTAACDGGGVWQSNYSSVTLTNQMTLSKCTISNNTASSGDGGGVYVASEPENDYEASTTIESSCKITGNNANGKGGGVYVVGDARAYVDSAIITGNVAGEGGGIYVDGTLQLSGTTTVDTNTKRADSVANNVYLPSGKKIVIAGSLGTGTHIGVSTQDASTATTFITSNYSTLNAGDPSAYFVGDDGRVAALVDKEVRLATGIPYIDENGETKICSGYTLVTPSLSGDWGAGWYVVYGDVTLNYRPNLTNDTKIILCDGAHLTCSKGLGNPDARKALTIYCQEGGTGKLTATGSDSLSGIGDVTLRVYGGTVEATGGNGGAGIGGKSGGDSGDTYVYGGTVTARGGSQAPGIGSGNGHDYTGKFYIKGGTVTAIGGSGAAGIGGGQSGKNRGQLFLQGGSLRAEGGTGAAGIDVGIESGTGRCFFNGCDVEVVGGANAKAIGCGSSGTPTADTIQILIDKGTWGDEDQSSLDYMISAGAEGAQLVKILGTNRKSACLTNQCAHFQPCVHSEYVVTTAADGTKTATCKYCGHSGQACTISFSAGTGTGSMDSIVVVKGDTYVIPDGSALTAPEGLLFTGWAHGDESYVAGETITVNEDIALTAQWTMTWASLQELINSAPDGGRTKNIRLLNDVVASDTDTALTIPARKSIRIILSGHSLNRNINPNSTPSDGGSVIVVNGELKISGSGEGEITGGCALTGGGVLVDGGYFVFVNGSIAHNVANYGGGVYVKGGGTADINGGHITDNAATSDGGGIFVENGSVTQDAAYVDSNSAKGNGGGVAVQGGSYTFEMGSITNNMATETGSSGGGVYVSGGAFSITHGTIENNSAKGKGGGIAVLGNASFTMGDMPKIASNTVNSSASNVYLGDDTVINVTKELLLNDPIGISTEVTPTASNPIVVTSGLLSSGKAAATKSFTSEMSNQVVSANADGEAVLGEAVTITFKPGEGEGEMSAQTVVAGSTYELPACEFEAPRGLTFAGWMVGDDPTVRMEGESVLISANTMLTAKWEAKYLVWVGGVQITASNQDDVLGDGTVSFNGMTSTLMINGLGSITGTHNGSLIYAEQDLTITGSGSIAASEGTDVSNAIEMTQGSSVTLNGDFVVRGGDRGIYTCDGGSVTLDGTINVSSTLYGIHTSVSGDVTVKGGAVTVSTQGRYAIVATNVIVANDITSLEATATGGNPSALNARSAIQLGDRLYFEVPQGATVKSTGTYQQVFDGRSAKASHVIIKKKLTPEFKTHSLVLSGKIGVNFFVDMSMLDSSVREASTMEFTVSGKGGFTTTVPFKADFTSVTGGYYGFTCYVNSIQMADTITATLHFGEGDSISEKYSILDYVDSFEIVASQFDTSTVAMVKALADYGHYMQPLLSDTRGWTIGKDYAEMTKVYTQTFDTSAISAAVSSKAISTNLGSSDVETVNYLLHFDTDTAIYVFFTPKKGYSGNVTATIDGASAEAAKLKNGRYRVTVSGISAHQLGIDHTVTLTTSSGTATVQVSGLSYVNSLLQNMGDNEHAKNAAGAIYQYYQAAVTYKAQHQSDQ